MPVSFSSPPRNLFLLGSSGADVVSNFFAAVDGIEPGVGYDVWIPDEIRIGDEYGTGRSTFITGTGQDTNSKKVGFINEQRYYEYYPTNDPNNPPDNLSLDRKYFINTDTSTSLDTTLRAMELFGSAPNHELIVVGKTGSVPWIAKYIENDQTQWVSTSNTADVEYTGVCKGGTNYYACGSTAVSGDAVSFVEKFDSNGNTGWGKSATMLGRDVVLEKITANSRDEIIAVGYLEDDTADKGYIVKIDANTGEILWDRSLERNISGSGNSGGNGNDDIASADVRCTACYIDGNDFIYVVGSIDGKNPVNNGVGEFLVKYSPEGNILWQRENHTDHYTALDSAPNMIPFDVKSDTDTQQTVVLSVENQGSFASNNSDIFISKYSKDGTLVFRRQISKGGNTLGNASLDADPSFYYVLFTDQQTVPISGTPDRYFFGRVSTSGNGLGAFQYDDGGTVDTTPIDYTIVSNENKIGRLSDGSVRNDTSDFVTYPFTANKLVFDDLATPVSNKKKQMDSADSFEYGGSPAIRPADNPILSFGSQEKTGTTSGIGELTSISMVASAYGASPSSGPVTVTAPAGIQAGDLLIINGVCPNTSGIDLNIPTGFTIIEDDENNVVDHRLSYKIAAGDESGTTYSGQTPSAGDGNMNIFVFRGNTSVTSVSVVATSRWDAGPGSPRLGSAPSSVSVAAGSGGSALSIINTTSRASNTNTITPTAPASGWTNYNNINGTNNDDVQALSWNYHTRNGNVTANTAFGSTSRATAIGCVLTLNGGTTTTTTSIVDMTGNSNDGIVDGATQDANDHWGFDASNQNHIDVPNFTSANNIDFSIEVWWQADSLPSYSGPTSKGYIFDQTPVSDGVALRISTAGDITTFAYPTGGGAVVLVNSGTTVQTGVWYHTVSVFETNKVSLYVNGILVGTSTGTMPSVNAGVIDETYPFTIGSGIDSSVARNYEYFDGKMGEFRIYQKALTSAQVFQNYNSTKSKYINEASNIGVKIGNNKIRYNGLILNYDFGNKFTYDEAQNLITDSQDFDKWTLQPNCSVADSDIPSPLFGDKTVSLITANQTEASLYKAFTGVANTNITYSVFLKAGSVTQLRLRDLDGGSNPGHNITFDLETLTFSDNNNIATTGYEAYPNGWYRVYFTIATGSYTNLSFNPRPTSSQTGTWYMWGAQVEVGSTAGRYIKTYGDAITAPTTVKNLSSDSLNGTIDGAVFNNSGYFEFDGTNDLIDLKSTLSTLASETLPASWEAWVYFNAGTGNNQNIIGNAFANGGVLLRTTGTSHAPADRIRFVYFINGSNGTGVDSASALTTGWHHIVATYNGNGLTTSNFGLYIDGSPASTTDPTFGSPSGSSIPQTQDFGIGGLPDEAGQYYWNGKIGEFRLYNRVLLSSEVSVNYLSTKSKYGL